MTHHSKNRLMVFLYFFICSSILLGVSYSKTLLPFQISNPIVSGSVHDGILVLVQDNGKVFGFSLDKKKITFSIEPKLSSTESLRVIGYKVHGRYIYILWSNGVLKEINMYNNYVLKDTILPFKDSIVDFDVDGNNVYFASTDSIFRCNILSSDTCKSIFSIDKTSGDNIESIIVWTKAFKETGKRIIIQTKYNVYIITPTGSKVMDMKSNDIVHNTAVFGTKLFIPVSTGVYVYDVETGKYLGFLSLVGKVSFMGNVQGDLVIGTTSGYLYVVDLKTLSIIYTKHIFKHPVMYVGDGRISSYNAYIIASTNTVAGISKDDGTLLWLHTYNTPVIYIFVYGQNTLVLVDKHTGVLSFSLNNTCSILTPDDGSTLNYRNLRFSGISLPPGEVSLSFGGTRYDTVDTDSKGLWSYVLDPDLLSPGWNALSCGDPKSTGSEISVYIPDNFEKGKFHISYPPSVTKGEEFTINVIDSASGTGVDYFYIQVGDEDVRMVSGSKGSLNFPAEGKYTIKISREGYITEKITINVGNGFDIFDFVLTIIGVIVLLGLAYFLVKNIRLKDKK